MAIDTSSIQATFPYLNTESLSADEKSLFIGRLEFESKLMEEEFIAFVATTGLSLQDNNVSPHHICRILEDFGMPGLSGETTSSAISKISKNYSFFNYRIMKIIINEWGNDTDKERLYAYEAKFKEYCKRRICEVPTDVLTSDLKANIKLRIKTDKSFDVPASEINSLAYELSKLLDTPLLLCKVSDGCVDFVFNCLKANCLFYLQENDCTEVFKNLGITKVYTENQVFYEETDEVQVHGEFARDNHTFRVHLACNSIHG